MGNRGRIEAKNSLENYAFQMRTTMADEKLAGKVSEDDKKKVNDAIQEVIQWLDSNQQAEKEEYEAKQKNLESIVLPILQNLSGGEGGMPGGIPGGAPASSGPAEAHDDGPKIEEID